MSVIQLYQIALKPGANWQIVVSRLTAAEGCEQVVHAPQHEDSNILGIAAVWKSIAAQKSFSSSSAGADLKTAIEQISSNNVSEDVVVFDEDASASIGARVVELVSWIHPVSQINKPLEEKCLKDYKHFQKAISKDAPEADGGLVAGWGQIEFDHKGAPSRRFTSFIGWKSVKAHYDCKKTKTFLDNIHWLMDNNHSDIEMAHYAYSKSL